MLKTKEDFIKYLDKSCKINRYTYKSCLKSDSTYYKRFNEGISRYADIEKNKSLLKFLRECENVGQDIIDFNDEEFYRFTVNDLLY